MAYRIDPSQPAGAELRRIAIEEIDAALRSLGDPEREGLEKTVHGVRKRCKRLRALVRMVRPALGGEYRRANALAREASAVLSPMRDAHAVLATFDDLVAARADVVPVRGLRDVRGGLAARAVAAEDAGAVAERLGRAAALLGELRDRVPDWPVGDGLRPVLAGAATYQAAGRAAFHHALEDPSEEALHEWRKRVKDGWHHAQLLRELAPSVFVPLEGALHSLSDALGDNNDLAVLDAALRAAPDELGGAQAHEALLISHAVREELVARCLPLGARIYADRRKAYERRLRGYAAAYRAHGPERPVGSIADVLAGAGDRP